MGVGGAVGGRWLILFGVAPALVFAACAARQPVSLPKIPPPPPAVPGESAVGVASWYGPGFNGRHTASGEVYNQEDMTAASNSFPLGTRLMVTNPENNRSVEVRVNDRGPFRKGRMLDLSHAAARLLGIVQPGTATVRMVVLSAPAGVELAGGAPRYFVQVGSFAVPSHAEVLRGQLAAYYPDVRIDQIAAGCHRYYRVRMGAFPSRDAALARASQTARFGLPILIVAE